MFRLVLLAALAVPALARADDYGRRLDALDHRLQELKVKVLDSQGRLEGLRQRVFHGDFATVTRVVHKNEMGAGFALVALRYDLDGAPVFDRSDERGLLGPGQSLEVLHRPLAPVHHTLSVKLVYRGASPVFKYVEGYRFIQRASHTFAPADGRETRIEVVGRPRGNPFTTDLADRPAIDFRDAGRSP